MIRRLLAAALLATCLTVPLSAAPALAAPAAVDRVCVPTDVVFGGKITWHCVWVPLFASPPVPPPYCPQCAAFDLGYDPSLPLVDRAAVDEHIVEGIDRLVRADLSTDPAERSRWRDAAMDSFTAAAADLHGTGVGLASVGSMDQNTGAYTVGNHGWLRAAGTDLAAGVSLLGSIDPDGDPAGVAAAQARIDRAYRELTNRRT
jgi:hypothetical protein